MAWGCLALVELSRRGLLLPRSFPRVVPVIVKALHYDVRRGPHSVGSHVRDAAAYVCWAFGRAYYHKDMKNVLDQLAPDLLIMGCFDREVKEVSGSSIGDMADMLVWGGVGTRMDAKIDHLLLIWSKVFLKSQS